MGIEWLLERMKSKMEEPAIIWRDQPYSYGQILDGVAFWQNWLKVEGVHPGEIVALEGDYSPKTCALLLSLIDQKNVIVPITVATGAHRGEFLEIAEVQVVITLDDQDLCRIERRPTIVKNALTLQLIGMAEPGLILFSSGSSGKNKAVIHNFTRLLEKNKTSDRRFRTITFLLFDHIGGINTLFYNLSSGGTVISVYSRDPEVICQAIEKHKVELLPTSPTFLKLLLISEAYSQYDLSSLKLITYGTEVMPESTMKRLNEVFPNVRLQQTYGLSELGILRSKSRDQGSLWVKVGGKGFETKVVEGTLHVRAHSSMMGYLNAPSPFDEEGWMDTQDQVEVDGDYIRILGRRSDVINVGGQKVFPAEVENVIMQMENVRDATVRGEKNHITGSIVFARLVLDRPEDVSMLKKRVRNFCKDKLEGYKIPVKIEIDNEIRHTKRFKKVRS